MHAHAFTLRAMDVAVQPRVTPLATAALVAAAFATAGCSADSAQTVTFEIPERLGAPPGSYTIDGDARPVVIPFEFYGMNLMVDAEMDGEPVKMLIDNGVMWDELWFYTSDLTDSLGVEYEENLTVTGAGEGDGLDSMSASNITIRFGDIEFTGQPAIITPEEQGIAAMFPGVAGQLCGCFFKHFVTEFDFDEMVIRLHDPATYEYDRAGVALPMTRDAQGSYSIPVTVDVEGGHPIDLELFIDLGGIYAAHLVIDEEAGIPQPDAERVLLGYGASGPVYGYNGTVAGLRVGGYTLTDPPAVFTESPDGGDSTDMLIGLPAFKRFTVVFDYFRELLYLEPNGHFDDPYGV